MAIRGLELSEEKTRITHMSAGFDFLGQNVRKYSGKLLIKPTKRSVKSLLGKVRGIIKANTGVTQAVLIQQLNPVIRGWTVYHRHVVAKACYSSIDSQIWRLLWKWAVRRHPTKGARWVRQKYFHAEGNRSWVFAPKMPCEGDNQRLRLFRSMTISIVRHVKIRSMANPFDPAWMSYFARRRTAIDTEKLLGAAMRC
jgi:RNA-directed DNA polymerase